MKFTVYTDGSTKGNGTNTSVGAWAYVILDEYDNELGLNVGAEKNTTNQRMELAAALNALEYIGNAGFVSIDEINIYSDSAYLINCYQNKWYDKWLHNGWKTSKGEAVVNKDLWLKLIPFFFDTRIHWHKCKGHSGDKWNECVDAMAQSKAEELKKCLE